MSRSASHDANSMVRPDWPASPSASRDRKSTRLNSSHSQISYAVFCLKKKKTDVPRKTVTIPSFFPSDRRTKLQSFPVDGSSYPHPMSDLLNEPLQNQMPDYTSPPSH